MSDGGRGDDVTEALDLVVLHALLEGLAGGEGLRHPVREPPLQQRVHHHQTLACRGGGARVQTNGQKRYHRDNWLVSDRHQTDRKTVRQMARQTDRQTGRHVARLTGLQLAGKAQHFRVVWDHVLVQFAQDEDLWPPVLRVGRSLLQLEQTVASNLQTEPPHTVTPLLLSTGGREQGGREVRKTEGEKEIEEKRGRKEGI